MCGLFGSYRAEVDVLAGVRRLKHRGPDADDVRVIGGAVHGHARLAIQDPGSRSDQPFEYRGLVVSYVGELWNADALRDRLEIAGCEFETTGDTEVVAAAIWKWGAFALRLFDGMFAVAWTKVAPGNETWVGRDRLGKVPMYLVAVPRPAGGGNGWMWGTERKAFPSGNIQRHIHPVMPGTVRRLDTNEVFAFYGLEKAIRDYQPPLGGTEPERVRAWLDRAVRRRLVGDVPVCCLISGGLDSSAILALVKKQRPDVVAYTAYMDPESPDLAAAREVSAAFGVPLREVQVPVPDEVALSEAIHAIEISMKAQVEIATLCLPLAKQISEDGFKVVLSGEGADELFGGYGNTARKATSDESWKQARVDQIVKMGRGNHVRVNKAFMAHGVEARLPFMERPMVERVLGLGIRACPPGKGLLKEAVADLVPEEIIRRKKETFQGAGGSAAALEGLTEGAQVRRYNTIARGLFGGEIPRG